MKKTLTEFRLDAAIASNMTSYPVIKETVIRLLRQSGRKGKVLDFGAGRGELVQLLLTSGLASMVSGVDLFDRPDGIMPAIRWHTCDLNERFDSGEVYDVVICSEVIEHLENPRATFRNLHRLLIPEGLLILTMPNQESLKAYMALVMRGHFNSFLDGWYPAHITSLLRLDLVRICRETGFSEPKFSYTDEGSIPKLPSITWQRVTFGLLRGRLFSDNLAFIARKLPE